MIEISCATSALNQCIRVTGTSVDSVAIGSICIGEGDSDVTEEYSVEFGEILSQPHGALAYGRLRDKDVYHLNAKGTVIMRGGSVSGSPPEDPEDLGTVFQLDGVDTLVTIMSRWGEDSVFEGIVHVHRKWNSYYSDWVSEQYVPCKVWVRYGSSRAICYTQIDPWPSVLETRGITIAHNHVPERLCFVTRGDTYLVSPWYEALHDSCSNPTLVVGNYSRSWATWTMSDPDVNYATHYTPYPWLDVGGIVGSNNPDPTDLINVLTSKELRNYVRSVLISVAEPLAPSHEIWEDLVADVLEQQRFVTSNLFVSMFELTDWKSFVEQAKNWQRFIGDVVEIPHLAAISKSSARRKATRAVRSAMKESGQSELARRYGVLPTIRDFQAILEGWKKFFAKASHNRYHSRRTVDWGQSALDSPILSRFVLTAEVIPLPMDVYGTALSVIRGIRTTGFYPGWSAAWDATPYSFLMDGVVDVGAFFEGLDREMDKVLYPVHHFIESESRTWTPDLARLLPGFQVEGSIEFIRYERRVTGGNTLPATAISVDEGSASLVSLQGATLIALTRSM